MENIFKPADILLPDYDSCDSRWEAWSVIACDQFTSELQYWESAENKVCGGMSTLSLVLPEVYLGTKEETRRGELIKNAMREIPKKLRAYPGAMVYLERTLPDGSMRRGIVGMIDLEKYDYSPDSLSAVRATEATVVERIPPRVAIRREASVELPHVMLLTDDPADELISPLTHSKERLTCLYDFSLMLGGGRAVGYLVDGRALEALNERICSYEAKRAGKVVYAVGDGNHSLASAKAYYEELKAAIGDAASNHPARYALVEAVNIHEPSLEFEPIYRLVKNCDVDDFGKFLRSKCGDGEQKITAVTSNGAAELAIASPYHTLTVGSLQSIIDEYIAECDSGAVCDYIHGEDSLTSLASNEGCVGFLFDGLGKSELFGYVSENGALPRKTFSMGEAKSKRYYLEARKITP